MYLKDYLYKNNITIEDFANTIGINRTSLWRIMSGKFNPSYELMMKIYKKTNKCVGLDEIITPSGRTRTRVKKPTKKQKHN